MKEEPRIPTIIGLVILLVGLGSAIFLVEKGLSFFSQAKGTAASEITVANVSDSAFAVSWLTETANIGAIQYSEQGILGDTRVQYDIRDSQKATPRFTHFISVTNLKRDTTYKVKLLADATNNELTIKTGPVLSPPNETIYPAFGSVIDTKNKPADEVLVHASFEGSQTVSTITDATGNWVLPLGSLRATDASRYFAPTPRNQERIFFVGKQGSSIVTTTIANDSPLPLVRLGESYDFSPVSMKHVPIIAAAQGGFGTTVGSVNTTFQILTPTKNSSIPSSFPAIKGTGLPNKEVILSISEKPVPITQRVTITSNGTWNWSPKTALSPGKHILSALSSNTTGKPVALSVSFNVLKSGTSVLGVATGSGSLSSPLPSLIPSPLASPKASVSPIPSASISASPSAAVPVTGTVEPTLLIVLMAAVALGIGIFSFKKSA